MCVRLEGRCIYVYTLICKGVQFIRSSSRCSSASSEALLGDPTAALPHGTLLSVLERTWTASLRHYLRLHHLAVQVDLLMDQSVMTALRAASDWQRCVDLLEALGENVVLTNAAVACCIEAGEALKAQRLLVTQRRARVPLGELF